MYELQVGPGGCNHSHHNVQVGSNARSGADIILKSESVLPVALPGVWLPLVVTKSIMDRHSEQREKNPAISMSE